MKNKKEVVIGLFLIIVAIVGIIISNDIYPTNYLFGTPFGDIGKELRFLYITLLFIAIIGIFFIFYGSLKRKKEANSGEALACSFIGFSFLIISIAEITNTYHIDITKYSLAWGTPFGYIYEEIMPFFIFSILIGIVGIIIILYKIISWKNKSELKDIKFKDIFSYYLETFLYIIIAIIIAVITILGIFNILNILEVLVYSHIIIIETCLIKYTTFIFKKKKKNRLKNLDEIHANHSEK